MKCLQRDDEWRHRLVGFDAHPLEVPLEQLVVTELGGGKPREGGLVFERRRHAGVVRQTFERHQLGIGEHSEQVSDGVSVRRIGHEVDVGNVLLAHAPKRSAAAPMAPSGS